ncbi:MAG TPA: HEAT repeat domain-containing protein [Vicinamibacteria bacterium]
MLVALLLVPSSARAAGIDAARLRAAAVAGDWKQIQPMGTGVLPALARLYEASPEKDRATIAYVFYSLGWKSPDAKRVLMADVHTPDQTLRLQVQWALGRVSDDADVVDVLLQNMQNDPRPLFRDKAACALAYDQIHLGPAQKMRLFEGLVHALEDDKVQVRQIALQALQILTGQTKGFHPVADPEARRRAVEEWKRWLVEYRANL